MVIWTPYRRAISLIMELCQQHIFGSANQERKVVMLAVFSMLFGMMLREFLRYPAEIHHQQGSGMSFGLMKTRAYL